MFIEVLMSKTNSNSITGILIYELNNNEIFKKEMLKIFREKSKSDIPENILFYDGTHSPLKIKTMGEKEVDIYARVPGKYKIYLMIEVKAGINEDLQDSQKIGGEYWNTSKTGIPLFFIIPKAYTHKNDKKYIHENNIEWEEILKIANNCRNDKMVEQIKNFVEITEDDTELDDESSVIKKISKIEDYIEERQKSKAILDRCLGKISNKVFSETQYEFGYYWDNKTYFLGFNYLEDNYILSLDITESIQNTELGKDEYNFYFLEGWYFIPLKKVKQKQIFSKNNLEELFQKKYIKKIDFSEIDELNKLSPESQNNALLLIILLKDIIETIFDKNKDFELGEYQNTEYGIGYYFKEKQRQKRDFFIGLNTNLEEKSYWFSIAVDLNKVNKKEGWYLDFDEKYAYFKIKKDNLINCKNKEELRENLKNEIQRIINLI